MIEVGSGVTLSIISDRLTVIRGKKILPLRVAVGVNLAVLLDDVAIVVILHRVDNGSVHRLGKKLTKRIVSIFGGTVNAIGYLGDSLLRVILIRKSSSS